MKSLNFWMIVFSLLLTISCSSDDGLTTSDSEIENVDESEDTLTLIAIENNNRQTLQSSVIVKVVDEEGNLVEGALVKILDTEVYTENGFAKLFNVLVNEDFTGVTISKSGYSTAVKSFTVSETHSNLLEVTLFEAQALTFNASEGTTLNFDENVSLDFPEDSLLNEDGSNFTGTAQVRLQYHEPNQVDYAESLPGTLVGLDTNGDYNALATEGMISIDLTDTSGNPLQIKDGESVNVRMPASVDAPDSILLWHLNEETGIWEEEGTATKNGSYYEFEVSHFSVYNLDYFIDAVDYIDFTVKSDSDILSNQKLIVYFEGSPIQEVVTDALGQFSLLYAPVGSYYLKPILCDGDIQSETLNITTAGQVEFEVPNFDDYIEGECNYIRLTGYVSDCASSLDVNENVFFTINEGQVNEQRLIYTISHSLYFSLNVLIYGPIDFDTINVKINYPSAEHEGYYEFKDIYSNSKDFRPLARHSILQLCDTSYFTGDPIDIDSNLYYAINNLLGLNEFQVITPEYANLVESFYRHYDEDSEGGIYFEFDLNELIRYFPNLKELTVEKEVTNINNLNQLEKLEYFKTSGSLINISSVELFSDMTNLTSLLLGSNSISDITPLSGLTNLTTLNLSQNSISNITVLSGLSNLTELHISYNNISDISPLSNLINLRTLSLRDNSISDISSLLNFPNLRYLNLSGNPLTEEQVENLRLQLPDCNIVF